MRSQYVFAAAKEISNRFLLCRVTAASARRLQIGSKQPSETINKSLNLIAAAALTGQNGNASHELESDSGHASSGTMATAKSPASSETMPMRPL
jgi:DNA-directed RNA polymerase subunit K/omega